MQGHQGKRSLLKKTTHVFAVDSGVQLLWFVDFISMDIMSVLPVSDRREHLLERPCVDERVGLRECQSMDTCFGGVGS